jgi:GT2 family glycosyltransferase
MNYKVVILSARAENLIPCVHAVIANEPDLPTQNILVVDDGAQQGANAALPGITWLAGSKPFVFARNANIGLSAAASDIILLNDDARLITPRGFTLLAEQTNQHPNLGICSASVRGAVGNPHQLPSSLGSVRIEETTLAFICIYIPWSTFQEIGPLDERFTGYGYDDDDYCLRVRRAGLQLGIWDGCIVDHSGELSSTYRTQADLHTKFRQNQQRFQAKWQTHRSDLLASQPGNGHQPQSIPSGLRLNLGCCESYIEGFINCDIFPPTELEPINFQQRWPWVDHSVAFVRAWDFIEHLPDKLFTMNELWRILTPGGKAEIYVPTTDGVGAFQDPTHISFWNRRSFSYYEAGNPYRERFAQRYGIHANFRVLREQTNQTSDGPRLTILLEAIKV